MDLLAGRLSVLAIFVVLVDANPRLNPFVIALREWGRIAIDVWRARTWRDRALLALGPPGWSPDRSRTTTMMVRAKAGRR